MFDFELKSKEHHKSDGQGQPICGAKVLGLVMLWDDEMLITCQGCLDKLRDDRIAARKAKEDNDDVELS
jgi:hypothetical protein